MENKLNIIIAGYERGGTTLMSDILRANGFESGFECGALLCETPRDFPKLKPYWDMLPSGWNLTKSQRDACLADDFSTFYYNLFSAAFPNHQGKFFDKTPKYMSSLGLCLNRAPFINKAIIVHRDPRSVFVSMAKRMSPNVSIEAAVKKNFSILKRRYISYFFGCIGHLDNPKVLFVPFEELVSREAAWMKVLGLFVSDQQFQQRKNKSRFENVALNAMDVSKVTEFESCISKTLQERILSEVSIASIFFADPLDRVSYGTEWRERYHKARKLLDIFEITCDSKFIQGRYFEPLTYLLRNPDILDARVNPIKHFENKGIPEGRRGY